jgi:hypothetical protein
MTGPFPGQGETPQPWGGRPRGSGQDGGGRDGHPTDPLYADAVGDPFGDPQDGPRRSVVVAIAVGVVVVLGAGVALWFTAGPGRAQDPRPVAVTSAQQAPPPVVHPTTTPSGTQDTAAAYDVGSCFDEANGGSAGKVELNPVPCSGAEAVFVINSVVPTAATCDSAADYRDHGFEVPDETAHVAYCASLVVPVNVCFVLGGSAPVARVPCGSAPDAVQVLAIESAPSPKTACTDQTNPDVWYFQAPTSGQFACVSRPGTNPTGTSSTPAPTTGSGTRPTTPVR